MQVLAVAAFCFAGVKYMFASADTKANLKNKMVGLMVGAVLVFGASSVISLITKVTSDIATAQPAKPEDKNNKPENKK